MKDFKDLKVWQNAHELALAVYRTTNGFPKEELYGLTSQIRRASVSIPANIAEGCGRSGDPEFARFLQLAMGSASELEYHVLLAKDLKMLPLATFKEIARDISEIKKMLASLIGRLRTPIPSLADR